MLPHVPPADCMGAREAASARLDGELSELEDARLDVHLARCPACAVYARGMAETAAALRAAPLERPGPIMPLRHQRRLPRFAAAAAAAAVVAAAVLGGTSVALDYSGGGRTATVGSSGQLPLALRFHEQTVHEQLLAFLSETEAFSTPNGRMRAV